jgi:DNA modification methylase
MMSIELNKIYNEDCLKTIERFDDNFIDLIITSPPYNVNHKAYIDDLKHEEYIKWLEVIFTKLYSKMKIGGRICINIGDGKNGSVSTHSDIIQFMKKLYLSYTTIIWNIKPETNQKKFGHTAMFPEEIPKRMMKMFSYMNAIVYDPFMGAGTTAVACKKFNRNYVGSEVSKEYCDIAESRILNC